MYSYQIYTRDDVGEVRGIWKSLQKNVKVVGLTNQWEWVQTWIEVYGGVVDYSFFGFLKNDQPVGITIIVKETHRQFSKLIRTYHIGTNGEPLKDQARLLDNRLLVPEEEKTVFIQEILSYLSNVHQYEEAVFNDYNAEEAHLIADCLRKNKIRFSIKKEVSPEFNLKKAREEHKDPLDYLGKNARHNFRRTMRDLGEDTHIEWAKDPEHGLAILKDLITFYEDKWVRREGRGSMFHSELYSTFHQKIIKKFITKGNIMLTRLVCKKFGTLACAYFFIDNGVAYGYQVGQRDYANLPEELNFKKLKVGFVLHILNMKKCLEKGINVYNHTFGGHRYKWELSNEQSETVTISIKGNIKPYIRDSVVRTYEYIDSNKHLSKGLWILRKTLKV